MVTRGVAIVLLALVASLLSQPVKAKNDLREDLANADKALAEKRYDAAYEQYARLAPVSALAQFDLGLIEQQGWGRAQNAVAACGWFEKAAQGAVPAAQQFFGDCLAQGIGREADGEAAVRWYGKAAAAGIAYAGCEAGDLYIAGRVIAQDVARGVALCVQAAQAGSALAMTRLAGYYDRGEPVPRNLAAARYWYEQAAQRNDAHAQYRLGVMLNQGEGGKPDPQQALFWLETAASQGYAKAYLPVAILYANTPPDPKTGALPPQTLARIYMWNRAASLTEDGRADPAERAEIAHIEQMTLAVMPVQWQPELDRRVAAHLAQFATP